MHMGAARNARRRWALRTQRPTHPPPGASIRATLNCMFATLKCTLAAVSLCVWRPPPATRASLQLLRSNGRRAVRLAGAACCRPHVLSLASRFHVFHAGDLQLRAERTNGMVQSLRAAGAGIAERPRARCAVGPSASAAAAACCGPSKCCTLLKGHLDIIYSFSMRTCPQAGQGRHIWSLRSWLHTTLAGALAG